MIRIAFAILSTFLVSRLTTARLAGCNPLTPTSTQGCVRHYVGTYARATLANRCTAFSVTIKPRPVTTHLKICLVVPTDLAENWAGEAKF